MAPSSLQEISRSQQTPDDANKATPTTEPSRHNDEVVPSASVELHNLESTDQLNDISTPSSTLNMGFTISPVEHSSTSVQREDVTSPAEESNLPSEAGVEPSIQSPVDDALASTPTDELPRPLQPAATKDIDPATVPAVNITLLLITGARHPYKVDERYLKKRGVTYANNDPFTISVYTLKELIWKDWREEWEPRPTSPSSIRLIQFGRLLEDKAQLKDCRFNAEANNVLHMSIKPQEVVDDEDGAKAKHGLGRDRDGNDRTATCRCVIL